MDYSLLATSWYLNPKTYLFRGGKKVEDTRDHRPAEHGLPDRGN